MPDYRLYYFDVRGRGELIRLIFAYAGEPFDDFRFREINGVSQWFHEYKASTYLTRFNFSLSKASSTLLLHR